MGQRGREKELESRWKRKDVSVRRCLGVGERIESFPPALTSLPPKAGSLPSSLNPSIYEYRCTHSFQAVVVSWGATTRTASVVAAGFSSALVLVGATQVDDGASQAALDEVVAANLTFASTTGCLTLHRFSASSLFLGTAPEGGVMP